MSILQSDARTGVVVTPRRALVLGGTEGRRAATPRPHARRRGGDALPSWKAFSNKDPLDERAVEQMVLVGVDAGATTGRSRKVGAGGVEDAAGNPRRAL